MIPSQNSQLKFYVTLDTSEEVHALRATLNSARGLERGYADAFLYRDPDQTLSYAPLHSAIAAGLIPDCQPIVFVYDLYVDPKFRGRLLGAELVARLCRRAALDGYEMLIICPVPPDQVMTYAEMTETLRPLISYYEQHLNVIPIGSTGLWQRNIGKLISHVSEESKTSDLFKKACLPGISYPVSRG